LLPSFNEGNSLINFVLELKDFRRIFHHWEKKQSVWENTKRTLLHVNKDKRARENVSDALLAYSFGWAPFVGDLIAFYKGLQKFAGRIRWLRRNAGKPLTNRLQWKIRESSSTTLKSSGGMNLGFTGNGSIESWPGYSYKVLDSDAISEYYHATLLYRYSVPKMSDVELKIRAFLDMIGVRLDAGIIWNALPWTFVVDWVWDVGSYLRSFSVDNLGLTTEVLDFSHSVKSIITRKRSLVCYKDSDIMKTPLFGTPIDVMSVTNTRYERARSNPDLHAITTSDLNLRKLALGLALGVSKSETTKRRKTFHRSGRRDAVMTESW
jgi:hypothetical protein